MSNEVVIALIAVILTGIFAMLNFTLELIKMFIQHKNN